MFVVKRNGRQERVQFDKITSRITKLAYNLNMQFVDPGEWLVAWLAFTPGYRLFLSTIVKLPSHCT
jgi:hypothetical protein